MSSTSVQHGRGSDEEQPLLRRRRMRKFPSVNLEHWSSHPLRGQRWTLQNTRQKARQFLSSKFGHYSVLTLVSLDVLSMILGTLCSTLIMSRQLILVDFVLKLFKCEQGKSGPNWDLSLKILDSISLSFSCLFMVELMTSVWAFGWKYGSPIHLILTNHMC